MFSKELSGDTNGNNLGVNPCRWLSRDPIAEGGGLNLYRYVLNSPVGYLDPDGQNPIAIAGAIIGGGLNAINSYGAYQSENISGADYAASIAFGAGTGALAGFAPGILGGALLGSLTSAVNNVFNQALTKCQIDGTEVAKAAILGLGGGALGGAGARLGSLLYRPVSQIGRSFVQGGRGAVLEDLGNVGGVIGNAVGTIGTNNW